MSGAAGAPDRYVDAKSCVDAVIGKVGKTIVLGVPLALGKPNHLTNAFYARAKADSSIDLTIYTALTLEPPTAPNALAARLLEPIAARLYDGYPALDYATDRRAGTLPGNVTVKEFFLPPGGLLDNAYAQRNYVSANYTQAGREILNSGLNVIAQMVASEPDGDRFSLSCNPDLSLDMGKALREQEKAGRNIAIIGEINADLPFLGHDAAVDAGWFDGLYDAGRYTLFPVPARKVTLSDHALGLHAATLVKDGGTLQIGIGALADAVSHAIGLRHEKNAAFNETVSGLKTALGEEDTSHHGGLGPFKTGLYGCSEMVTDGLLRLLEAGILSRDVYDDVETQKKALESADFETDRPGFKLHGAFYLGPARMYERLRTLPDALRNAINMTSVSRVNDLFGDEKLDRMQRRDARFFNTAMMIDGRGGAISDTLEGGRVVSGVGGQYNFVAMAHALEGGRSIIMLRATRIHAGRPVSNIIWTGGEITVPRHLRDIVVTEYGIADLRGKTDREVAVSLAKICDSRFQKAFLDAAKAAGKLEKSYQLPPESTRNRPEIIKKALENALKSGLTPPYPLGTDLTDTEIELKEALEWLGEETLGAPRRLSTIIKALLRTGTPDWAAPALERMGLAAPQSLTERLENRLVVHALRSMRRQDGTEKGDG